VEFRPPRCTLFLDTTGEPETEPARIAELLLSQLTAPVRWTRLVERLFASGVREFVEVGPGKALRGLLRKCGAPLPAYRAYGVNGPRGLSTLPPLRPFQETWEAAR
jgi:[acyl-carrier-protein] S-malonyltransferase